MKIDTQEARNCSEDDAEKREIKEALLTHLDHILEYLYSRIMVQFLTLNLYYIVRDQLRKNIVAGLKKQLEETSSTTDELKTSLPVIEKASRRKLLFDMSKILDYTKRGRLHQETDNLVYKCLKLSETKFTELFTGQLSSSLKFRFASMKLKFQDNLRSSSNDTNPKPKTGKYRFFGRFSLVKIFFPSLVYNADLVQNRSSLIDLFKSLVGIVFAGLLTSLFYLYFRYELRIECGQGFISLLVVVLILGMGLGFKANSRFRCITLLVIPFMTSSRGRAFFLMNCLSLSTTHITPNVLKNIQILRYSYACNKQLVRDHMIQTARESDTSLLMKKKIGQLKEFSRKMQKGLKAVKRVVDKPISVIRKFNTGLDKMANICERIFGNKTSIFVPEIPTDLDKVYGEKRPKRHFPTLHRADPNYVLDYQRMASFLTITVSHESSKHMCRPSSAFDHKVDESGQKANSIVDKMQKEFEFVVKQKRKAKKIANQTVSYLKAGSEILDKYFERFELINEYVPKIQRFTSLSLIFVFLAAFNYHRKYLKHDHYQNYVIGVRFYELDEKRRLKNQPTLLPLHKLLRESFTGLFDLVLTKKELKTTFKSVFGVCAFLFFIYLNMIADHALFTFCEYLRMYAKIDLELDSSQPDNQKIEGTGLMANAYRHIFDSFIQPDGVSNKQRLISNVHCLPLGLEPKYDVYKQIGVYTVILLVVSSLQAYTKRLRSVLAGSVYPNRDFERSIWLYNYILSVSSNIGLTHHREKQNTTCLSVLKRVGMFILNAVYSIWMMAMCCYCCCSLPIRSLGVTIQRARLSVGLIVQRYWNRQNEDQCSFCFSYETTTNLTRCSNSDCACLYCIECFEELRNQCKSCKWNIIRNVDDEQSEEEDSSDDEIRDKRDSRCSDDSFGLSSVEERSNYGSVKFLDQDLDIKFKMTQSDDRIDQRASSLCSRYSLRRQKNEIIKLDSFQLNRIITEVFGLFYSQITLFFDQDLEEIQDIISHNVDEFVAKFNPELFDSDELEELIIMVVKDLIIHIDLSDFIHGDLLERTSFLDFVSKLNE